MAPKLSATELAQQYGYALAFLKSDKSLWSLFNNAVKGNWTPDKFTAELKNTSWFKHNAEQVRQYDYLAKTDPATLNARLSQTFASIRDSAEQLGASMNAGLMSKLAQSALKFGWNDAQIRDHLGMYVRAVNGVYSGSTGTDIEAIKQTAWRNGLSYSGPTLQKWAQQIATGTTDKDFLQAQIRHQAKSLAPAFAEQLDSGMDLFDVAQPYMQSKAKILEMDPASVDLFDSDVRKALSATGTDGKPASQSIWQFEQGLRKNPMWLKTQNAQDSLMAAGHNVLQAFGFRF